MPRNHRFRILGALALLLAPACGGDDPAGPGRKDIVPPAAVADLGVTERAATSLLLEWTAPGDDGESGRAYEYDLRYSFFDNVTPDNWKNLNQVADEPIPADPGTTESFLLENQLPGVVFYVAIRTRDEVEVNWSPLSNIVVDSTVATGDVMAPAAITDLEVVAVTVSSVTLAWTATGDDGAAGRAAAYDLRYSADSAVVVDWEGAIPATGEPAPRDGGEADTAVAGALPASTTLFFGLRARDDGGNESATSNIVRATTEAADGAAPAAVTDLAVLAVSCSTANLTWTAPGDDDGVGTAAAYDVRFATFPLNESSWKNATGAEGEPSPSPAGATETFTVTGLAGSTAYWFALKSADEVLNVAPISTVVDIMLSRALRDLTGEPTNAAAWDALFRASNIARGKGDVGYAPGEKIAIKVNLVGCHYLYGGVDPVTYDLTSLLDYMNTSPQTMLALVRGLVHDAGVPPGDIAIGDPTARFPNEYHDPIAAEFPGLVFLDHDGGAPGHPRTAVQFSTVPLFWSIHPEGVASDYVPRSNAEAEYFVSLGSFKSHKTAGVTLCAKNLYGSLIRIPTAAGYYNLHDHLPARLPATGSYRPLVDLMGHAEFGGKALLYLIDALYSGVHNDDVAPRRWNFAPFSGDWTSSLFASQDPVAIESVAFDFMQHEGDPHEYPQMPGADDYLTEAALAADPPSGTFYDPNHDGDVERLPSLGVHEHWNDPVSMNYSRNLGSGEGIELVRVFSPSTFVAEAAERPPALSGGAPNPFRESVTLFLPASEEGARRASVYDVRGRFVRGLEPEAGPGGVFVWDGRDGEGREAPPGVYFVRSGSGAAIRRLVKVR